MHSFNVIGQKVNFIENNANLNLEYEGNRTSTQIDTQTCLYIAKLILKLGVKRHGVLSEDVKRTFHY